MSVYVDSSAVLKIYLEEPDSDRARALLGDPTTWTTARHTSVEVRRNLARVVEDSALASCREWFDENWSHAAIVELSVVVCERAAEIAERTGVRTMDALHLGAAAEAGADDGLPIVTFDQSLGDAARSLGWRVLPE